MFGYVPIDIKASVLAFLNCSNISNRLWCKVRCIHHVAIWSESPHPRLSCTESDRKRGLIQQLSPVDVRFPRPSRLWIADTLLFTSKNSCNLGMLIHPFTTVYIYIGETMVLTADPSSQSLDMGYPWISIFPSSTNMGLSEIQYPTIQWFALIQWLSRADLYKSTTFGGIPIFSPKKTYCWNCYLLILSHQIWQPHPSIRRSRARSTSNCLVHVQLLCTYMYRMNMMNMLILKYYDMYTYIYIYINNLHIHTSFLSDLTHRDRGLDVDRQTMERQETPTCNKDSYQIGRTGCKDVKMDR